MSSVYGIGQDGIKTYSDYANAQADKVDKLTTQIAASTDPATIQRLSIQIQALEENITYANNVADLILTASKPPS